MNLLRIASYNVNGLLDETKRRKIFRHLHEKKFEMICLQESHSTKEVEKRWKTEWGGRIFYAHGTRASRGTCILLKKHLKTKIHFVERDPEGRYLIMDLSIRDTRYTIVNVYGPNEDRPQFYRNLFTKIQLFDNDNKILMGDFNLALDILRDKDPRGTNYGGENLKQSAIELINFLEANDMVDIWREFNPDKFRLTWHSGARKSQIDYIFILRSQIQLVQDIDILPSFLSDHSIPILSIMQDNYPRGRGYWKFNNSLLEDKKFIEKMNETIADQLAQFEFESVKEKYDFIKMKLRSKCMEYSIIVQKNKNKTLQTCEEKLKKMEENIDNFSQQEFNQVVQQYHELQAEKTRAALIRTRSEWLQNGEKPTRYFLNLEKHLYNKKVIKRLKLNNGEYLTNPDQILKMEQTFFKSLYTSHFNQEYIDTSYLDDIELPRLKNADYSKLEELITLDEITDALNDLNHNKTPGLDGFTVEFYQTFWPKLGPFMLELYQEIIEDEFMNDSSTEGLITLLDKPDRDPLILPN